MERLFYAQTCDPNVDSDPDKSSKSLTGTARCGVPKMVQEIEGFPDLQFVLAALSPCFESDTAEAYNSSIRFSTTEATCLTTNTSATLARRRSRKL